MNVNKEIPDGLSNDQSDGDTERHCTGCGRDDVDVGEPHAGIRQRKERDDDE